MTTVDGATALPAWLYSHSSVSQAPQSSVFRPLDPSLSWTASFLLVTEPNFLEMTMLHSDSHRGTCWSDAHCDLVIRLRRWPE